MGFRWDTRQRVLGGALKQRKDEFGEEQRSDYVDL
jgi:hypothetical protein